MPAKTSPQARWERAHHAGDEAHLLREIMRVHQALLAVFSREVGAATSRLALLRLLAGAGPEGIGVLALARRVGVDAAAVSRQLTDMETERLVERRRDAGDARRSLRRLTPRGLRAFEAVHDRAHELERSLTSVASPEELQTAVRVLTQLRQALEKRR